MAGLRPFAASTAMRALAMVVMVTLPLNGAWLAVSSIVSPAHYHVAEEQAALTRMNSKSMAFTSMALASSPTITSTPPVTSTTGPRRTKNTTRIILPPTAITMAASGTIATDSNKPTWCMSKAIRNARTL